MDDPYTFMKSLADVYFTSQNAFSEEWRGHENCFAKVLKNEYKSKINLFWTFFVTEMDLLHFLAGACLEE